MFLSISLISVFDGVTSCNKPATFLEARSTLNPSGKIGVSRQKVGILYYTFLKVEIIIHECVPGFLKFNLILSASPPSVETTVITCSNVGVADGAECIPRKRKQQIKTCRDLYILKLTL